MCVVWGLSAGFSPYINIQKTQYHLLKRPLYITALKDDLHHKSVHSVWEGFFFLNSLLYTIGLFTYIWAKYYIILIQFYLAMTVLQLCSHSRLYYLFLDLYFSKYSVESVYSFQKTLQGLKENTMSNQILTN